MIRRLLCFVVVVGCSGDATQTGSVPQGLILDELHNGTAGFFWLPPIVERPAVFGDVVAGADPTVEIDRINDPVTGIILQHVATYTRTSGPFGERVRLKRKHFPPDDDDGDDDPEGFFLVRMDSDDLNLRSDGYYRIRVFVPGRPGQPRVQLGLADIDVVRSQRQFRRVDRDELVPLINGRVLRIKFRIDRPAVDHDDDGVLDWVDNCPDLANADQADNNDDGIGDACQCTQQCVASDECHEVGVCDPATGACTNPPVPDSSNTACTDDDNPCTVDVCRDGECAHVAGNAGAICRASAGACDVAERCDGTGTACPVDAKTTEVCRASAGACDAAESCDGTNNDCPADAKSAGVCRASAGACDSAERCDGTSNDCPADEKTTDVCRASAGVCDLAERCDGTSNDCPVDEKSTITCRDSAGPCDLAETCDGVANDCPFDAKSMHVCRDSAGFCDSAEICDGFNNACPADAKSVAQCRASRGACDAAESCDGTSDTCPPDAKSTSVCRGAAGVCDAADTCDGIADDCPADVKRADVCRGSAGACDLEESCDGATNDCPADAKSAGTCRAAAGVCDVAETCDGVSNDCAADTKNTAVCRASGGVCDLEERCDGSANDCPADSKSTSECRASAGACDAAESCDGFINECPADLKSTSTSVCRASAGDCDAAESCDGTSNDCPADGKSTGLCRSAMGVCDLAESCDGVSANCPADAKSTALCRAPEGECDLEESCDGAGNDCPADEKSTGVCRPSGGVCDVADVCDGTSNSCSADLKAASCPVTYSCECVGSHATGPSCGNGAIGGIHREVHKARSPLDVVRLYGPDRVSTRSTGWACVPEAAHTCTCVGIGAPVVGCGNGGIAGVGGEVFTDLTTAQVINLFGALRVGVEGTGWACRPSRIDSGNDLTYSCFCSASACGNGAVSAPIATTHAGLTLTDVIQLYGPDRIDSQFTGWQCSPEGLNVLRCEGPNGCGGGAPVGQNGDTLIDITTATAITTYGALRSGVIGWAITLSSY